MVLSLWLPIVVIAASAALATAGAFTKSRFLHYAFKPLTMVLVIFLAWERAGAAPGAYGSLILAGLGFGLGGDVLLMLPRGGLKCGLAAFAAGHLLYILAFAWRTPRLSLPVVAGLLVYGGGVYLFLAPGLGRLKLAVLAYIIIIVLMAALAQGRHAFLGDGRSLLALVGALLFLFSDTVNAIKRFRRPFPLAEILVLPAYFAAQLLLALSV